MPKVSWEEHGEKRQLDPISKRIRSLIILVLLAALAMLLLGGSFRVAFSEDSFGISAGLFGNEVVPFSTVTSLELQDGPFAPGARLSGRGSLRFAVGDFRGGGLAGDYRLYLEKSYDGPVLILRHQAGVLVIGANNLDIHAIHNELAAQTGR